MLGSTIAHRWREWRAAIQVRPHSKGRDYICGASLLTGPWHIAVDCINFAVPATSSDHAMPFLVTAAAAVTTERPTPQEGKDERAAEARVQAAAALGARASALGARRLALAAWRAWRISTQCARRRRRRALRDLTLGF